MYKCNNSECGLNDGITCEEGHLHLKNCEFVSIDSADTENPSNDNIEQLYKVFWSGSHLGFKDLQKLSDIRKPLIIGIVGSAEAGKSTILLSLYLQLLDGKKLTIGNFCGSYTLNSWETLAKNSRFSSPLLIPNFPPRTPRGDARTPGFLHLSFQSENDLIQDLIFIDSPGEWFNQWATDPNLAEGADWVIKNSDILIVTADSEKLSNKDSKVRGSSRHDLSSILDRLKDYKEAKHIALLWTKVEDNNEVKPNMREQIERGINSIKSVSTSIQNCSITKPDEMFNTLDTLIRCIENEKINISDPVLTGNAFEAFRGKYEHI